MICFEQLNTVEVISGISSVALKRTGSFDFPPPLPSWSLDIMPEVQTAEWLKPHGGDFGGTEAIVDVPAPQNLPAECSYMSELSSTIKEENAPN